MGTARLVSPAAAVPLEAWVQGEAIRGIRRLRFYPGTTVRDLSHLAAALRTHPTDERLWLFLENGTEPMADSSRLLPGMHPLHLHLHRCRLVLVTLLTETAVHTRRVSPATTTAQLAARLKLPPGRIVLRGTTTRLADDRHLGCFVYHPFIRLVLGFAPDARS